MRLIVCSISYLCFVPAIAQIATTEFTDVNGNSIKIQQGKIATVIVMLSPECPLCQSYSRTLNQLHSQYIKQGIVFYGIVPSSKFSVSDISEYKVRYNISFPVLFDQNMQFTRAVKAIKTPEVLLFDPLGSIRYRGRIDNWAYELGKKRKVITEHNLRDALDAILAGKSIVVKQTTPIGCYIEE